MVNMMVSAESWRKKRNPTIKAPSGDSYLIERPDPITLVQFLVVDCGLESPIDQKDVMVMDVLILSLTISRDGN